MSPTVAAFGPFDQLLIMPLQTDGGWKDHQFGLQIMKPGRRKRLSEGVGNIITPDSGNRDKGTRISARSILSQETSAVA